MRVCVVNCVAALSCCGVLPVTAFMLPSLNAVPLNVSEDPLFDMASLDKPIHPSQAYVHKGFWFCAANILALLK